MRAFFMFVAQGRELSLAEPPCDDGSSRQAMPNRLKGNIGAVACDQGGRAVPTALDGRKMPCCGTKHTLKLSINTVGYKLF